MIVITGPAYQGKLALAQRLFEQQHPDEENTAIDPIVHECTSNDTDINFDADIVHNLQEFLWGKVQRGQSAQEWAQSALPRLKNTLVICNDIASGVVPLDAPSRIWREETGRTMMALCQEADEVYRVFCGIETKIK